MSGDSRHRRKFYRTGQNYRVISDDAEPSGNSCSGPGKRKVWLPRAALNKLQQDFLNEFFSRESRFFLSGGAVLVSFFGHRETHDLDLFTLENEIDHGFAIAVDAARSLGAVVEPVQTSPDFRRVLITGTDESILVDLVREYVFQVNVEKKEINGLRVDSLEEIFANKLCALLSRSEIRDLIDVHELEKAGFSLEAALSAAGKKDLGLTPAQLSWVLSQIKIGDTKELQSAVSSAGLKEYLTDLILKLQKLALPKS